MQTAKLDNAVFLHLEKLYCVLELVWCKLQIFDSLIEQTKSLITACKVVIETHYQVRLACLFLELTLRKWLLNESWTNRGLNQWALDWTDKIVSGGFARWVARCGFSWRLKNFLAGRTRRHTFVVLVSHRDPLYSYGTACPFLLIWTNITILIEAAHYSLLLSLLLLLFFDFRVSRSGSGCLLVDNHGLLNCCSFLRQLDCASLDRLLWWRQRTTGGAAIHYRCFLL